MTPHPQTANALTLLRVALVPAFVVEYLVREPVLAGALAIFVVAATTDLVDGWVARRFDQTSAFGAFLDPVADKLMVVAALMLVCRTHPATLTVVASMIVILREIYVSALREWMAGLAARERVAVGAVGKWKTATQMLAIVLLLAGLEAGRPVLVRTGDAALAAAALLSLISCWQYSRAALVARRGVRARVHR